jgi:hypothetical protein
MSSSGGIWGHFRANAVGYLALVLVLGVIIFDGGAGGEAGGDLTGSYPDPQIAAGVITPGERGPAPAARVVRSTNQKLTNNRFVVIAFDVEQFDTAAVHGPPDPTRLTAPVAGVYEISGTACWEHDPDGHRALRLQVGGQADLVGVQDDAQDVNTPFALDSMCQNASTVAELAAGDFVQLQVLQSSGRTLGVVANAFSPVLSMSWIGPVAPPPS